MDNMDTLRYDRWIEDALKSVVRKALKHCQEHGLPGEHHFYITFATDHPLVIIPDSLRDQYPEEITIVIEHEYWDLVVAEDCFDVVLSFNDVKTPIHVPFEAITGFADPSVKFGLQFKMEMLDDEDLADVSEEEEPVVAAESEKDEDENKDNVVALDAFRKKK
ncbi:ClpXP protease specificity-enhancing factor SspB [Terasakiella sp. A23]|uniref:SspB family protein n=1 Tax=Terasakiella sp. FCG-A23 TaxID=3080561 RepID=UPI0029557E7D|nr:ClpXP protease specificity-enhancing factor SspB [Terasakiella sp. A23]MDV7341114.1 ClpXP protease specificity-enhancing factor SspB [Terasakiella sp. A23]